MARKKTGDQGSCVRAEVLQLYLKWELFSINLENQRILLLPFSHFPPLPQPPLPFLLIPFSCLIAEWESQPWGFSQCRYNDQDDAVWGSDQLCEGVAVTGRGWGAGRGRGHRELSSILQSPPSPQSDIWMKCCL